MTNSRRSRVLSAAVMLALALCLLALFEPAPAEAAFPGKNGKIFFQSEREGNPQLYSISPDGTNLRRLTSTGSNSDPAVSPDGTRVVFVSTDNQLFLMNADGNGRRQLTFTRSAKSDPAWSPDGTRIAFVANSFDVDGQTDPEIWTINSDGGALRQLTNNSFVDTDPAWSPLGERIAFVSERRPPPSNDTDRNIYVMNADGTAQTNITPAAEFGNTTYQGHDDEPAWSPDGSKIAYVHTFSPNASGTPNIWTMDPNGAGKTNVSNDPAVSATMPAWSPDGAAIAYVGSASGTTDRDIHVVAADGQNPRVLGDHPAHDTNPDWQQDSMPPDTTITSGPSGITRSASASLSFVSSEPDSSFECSLDGAAFSQCTSPKGYANLKNGSHTFRVRAADVAGNLEASPATRSWTVDATKPAIGGMLPRSGSVIRDTTPAIGATVRDNMTNLAKSNIKLYVAGKLIPASRYAYSRSADRLTYNSPALPKGKKSVRVVATDAAGNVGAGSWQFTIR